MCDEDGQADEAINGDGSAVVSAVASQQEVCGFASHQGQAETLHCLPCLHPI